MSSVGPNPSGLCMCGCGRRTRIAQETSTRWGLIKGQPNRYIHGHTQPKNYKRWLRNLRSAAKRLSKRTLRLRGQRISEAKIKIQYHPGQRLGRLTIIRFAGRNEHGARMFLCRCRCGVIKTIAAGTLNRGQRSCGCLMREKSRQLIKKLQQPGKAHPAYKIGRTDMPEGKILTAMHQRCTNPRATKYELYGGAGVKVCERWLGPNGFANFINDVGRRPSSKYSIGRYGDVGNYEPGNCKWMTDAEQKAEARKKRQRRAA